MAVDQRTFDALTGKLEKSAKDIQDSLNEISGFLRVLASQIPVVRPSGLGVREQIDEKDAEKRPRK